MGGKKPLRRPLWPPTRATASNYYPLGLDGAGGAAKPLLRAPKKPAPLHGRLPAFSGAVDAFERARKCFLEWRYFFSIILSEFLKNRVALHPILSSLLLLVLMKTVLFLGYVPTESMEPTLKKDSFILGTRLYGDLTDGDIIIFERDGRLLVKRITASGGEAVVRNGITLIVPENCYYVQGDNANHSYDSRFWSDPFVKESSIKAKLLG